MDNENLSKGSLNENLFREVTMKIVLKRINIQEEIIVKVLLDSGVIGLVMSS